jgi:hypothetical protein
MGTVPAIAESIIFSLGSAGFKSSATIAEEVSNAAKAIYVPPPVGRIIPCFFCEQVIMLTLLQSPIENETLINNIRIIA